MVKNRIFARTNILSFLDWEMIKILGLGTDLGKCGLNGDLLVLIFAISDDFWHLASIEHIQI